LFKYIKTLLVFIYLLAEDWKTRCNACT